jgi:hypothetical protein
MGFESQPAPEEEIPQQQETGHYPEPVHYPEQETKKVEDYEYLIKLEENTIRDIERQMDIRNTPSDMEARKAIKLHKERINGYRAKIEGLKQG